MITDDQVLNKLEKNFKCKQNEIILITMAEKRRFTTQMIARNMLKKIFVSLFWSVILIITVTIR